jgi:hypothetical protein
MYLIEQTDFIPTKTQRIARIDDTGPELMVTILHPHNQILLNFQKKNRFFLQRGSKPFFLKKKETRRIQCSDIQEIANHKGRHRNQPISFGCLNKHVNPVKI